MAHLFVAGVNDEVLDFAQRPVAPGLEFLVKQSGRTTDLRGRQALDPELAHHRFHIAGGDALDVHLGHCQHDGPNRPLPSFQRLGIEGLIRVSGGFGHLHADRARRCVEALGLVAIGIATSALGALIVAGGEEALAFNLHRHLEHARKDRGHFARAMINQLFQNCLNGRILVPVHSIISTVVSQLHGIPEWAARAEARLSTGFTPRPANEFPDVLLHHRLKIKRDTTLFSYGRLGSCVRQV